MGKSTYNVTVDEESMVRRESEYLTKAMEEEMNTLVNEARKRCR